MASVVVVEPAAEVLDLAACKAHLRVDHDDDDTLIGALARAAEQHLAGPDGWLGRSIGLVTLELRLGDPNCRRVALPYGPVGSVASVGYRDVAGDDQTIAPEDYDLIDAGTVAATLALRPSAAWPQMDAGGNALRIRYVAGYAADAVPGPLRQAMLLLVGHWYENREAVNVGNIVTSFPFAVEALAAPFRVWR